MTTAPESPFDSEEFDHICYAYRTAPGHEPAKVAAAFEAVRAFGRQALADECAPALKPSPRAEAAYERAKRVVAEAERQGREGEEFHGEPLEIERQSGNPLMRDRYENARRWSGCRIAAHRRQGFEPFDYTERS